MTLNKLGMAIAVACMMTPTLALAQAGGEPQTLDKVRVTGSAIKRTDVEAALPITVIQKAQIEA